jgi:hypothetical protein
MVPRRDTRSALRHPPVAPQAAPAPPAHRAVASLQRSVGNRGVAKLLRAPAPSGITVRAGSKLSAAQIAALLRRNAKLPRWVRDRVTSKGDRILLAKDAVAPAGEHMDSIDNLNTAFHAGDWQITTGRARIEVTDDGGKRKWTQTVLPDLGRGGQIGSWRRPGPGEDPEFFGEPIFLLDEGVQYGQTLETGTNKDRGQIKLIVVVTEITVTRPGAKGPETQTFTVGEDELVESIVHEISVHAGEMAQGHQGLHGGAWVDGLADEVGALFRPAAASGGLQPSALTKRIFAYVGPGAAVTSPP